jgi:hypothetical protein
MLSITYTYVWSLKFSLFLSLSLSLSFFLSFSHSLCYIVRIVRFKHMSTGADEASAGWHLTARQQGWQNEQLFRFWQIQLFRFWQIPRMTNPLDCFCANFTTVHLAKTILLKKTNKTLCLERRISKRLVRHLQLWTEIYCSIKHVYLHVNSLSFQNNLIVCSRLPLSLILLCMPCSKSR